MKAVRRERRRIVRRWHLVLFLALGVGPPLNAQDDRMVRVDGRGMRVRTPGLRDGARGRPVVVFESGAGTGLNAWSPVLQDVAAERDHFAEFRELPTPPSVPVSVLLANRLETQMWAARPCVPAVCRDEWMRQRIRALRLLAPPGRDSAITLSDESGHLIQRGHPSLVVSAIRRVLALRSARQGADPGAGSMPRSAEDQNASGMSSSSRRMADGKEWTTANLNVNASPSYCYDDAEPNCRRYGRLYTWESAQTVCQSLGDGWRLPTDDEWRQMARRYGGVSADSADTGRAAFTALLSGGTSGFDAVLGGNRSDGQYARLEAHGFYWTASENDRDTAPYYNFGRNGQALHRQPHGEKQMAVSVRCVRE